MLNTFPTGRIIFISVLVVFALVAWLLGQVIYDLRLRPAQYVTGWMLLIIIFSQILYHIKKNLSFVPLGWTSTWLQYHIYAGWLALAFFLFHIRFRLPQGLLENIIFVLFILVTLIGNMGHWLTRILPSRLTSRGGNIIFERIPMLRENLHQDVRILVESVSGINSKIADEFYDDHLRFFFEKQRNFWSHIIGSIRPRMILLEKIESYKRYLSSEEKEIFNEISESVCQKDDLDYHYTQMALLKGWLFIKIPLVYSFSIFIILHVVLVYSFG